MTTVLWIIVLPALALVWCAMYWRFRQLRGASTGTAIKSAVTCFICLGVLLFALFRFLQP